MSVFHRILAADDGSRDRQAALELAIAPARDQRALLTVVPEVPSAVTSVAAGPYDLEDFYPRLQRNAQGSIPADVPVTTLVAHGSPAHHIAAVADGDDLVVMGTHGRGRLGEALAGSVSRTPIPEGS